LNKITLSWRIGWRGAAGGGISLPWKSRAVIGWLHRDRY
jgi:hypothetical protein